MVRELVRRGNAGPHFVNDIRQEERVGLTSIPGASVTIGDYLTDPAPPTADFLITNPPFTKARAFVEKAKTHISGPICVLQSTNWLGGMQRGTWLESAGLNYVVNLKVRPKWEVDSGEKAPSNFWNFAWFVFQADHFHHHTEMKWL